MTIETDVGSWSVHETPGHAPSHVCLHQSERRLLISGDHLLGRVSLYFDYGWTPDPVGEFFDSLDRIELLDARLCMAGHGRTFVDLRAHLDANRALVAERLERVRRSVQERGPITAFGVVPLLHGEPLTQGTAGWWLPETLCYLRRLETTGVLQREGGDPERWLMARSPRGRAVVAGS